MKRWARRSKWLIVAYKVYQNWLMRRRFASGIIDSDHGSSHRGKSVAQSLSYIEEQFTDYLRYGGLSSPQLTGKTILELGFGDNAGVALKFLAAGAAKVVCVDKFFSRRDTAREQKIYLGLRESLQPEQRVRFDSAVKLDDGITFNETKLRLINGIDLEQAASVLASEKIEFDLIISRAVIEEIFEPSRMFAAADNLLAPAGLALHKIDLSDYGIFSDGGMHPLTFLTIPDSIYRLMAKDSGIPNRKLMGYYRREMERLGYSTRFLITGTVNRAPLVPHKEHLEPGVDFAPETVALIEEIRPRLCKEFRDLPLEELLISGIFLLSEKPAQAQMLQAQPTNSAERS